MPQFNTTQFNGGSGAAGVVSFSARDLIYRALRLLTVLRAGQEASPEQVDDGLSFLNDLVDAWNLDRFNLPSLRTDTYTLTAGKSEYTLGTGGDLDGPRPEHIETAVLVSGGIRRAFSQTLTVDEWAGRRVVGIYCDYGYPLAMIGITAAPLSSTDTLELASWQLLDGFDLETPVSMPAGYALALRYNLAAVMAPAMVPHLKETPMLDSIEQKAREYKGQIQSHNTPAHTMRCDAAVLSTRRARYDLNRDDY